MKITGLLVLKCNPEGTDPVILANATDVSRFFFFDRPSVRELIVFFSRTVAKQTPPGHHGTVQREERAMWHLACRSDDIHRGRVELIEYYKCTKNQLNRISLKYKVHSYSRNGLCVVGFMDDHYPVQSAFSLLNQVLDEYQKNFGDSWRTVQADSAQPWPYLNQALTKFQDPAEADKLLKIQGELDLTKDMVDETIKKVLERGEKLDSLMEKSSDLSVASRAFYNRAQQTNQCCTIL